MAKKQMKNEPTTNPIPKPLVSRTMSYRCAETGQTFDSLKEYKKYQKYRVFEKKIEFVFGDAAKFIEFLISNHDEFLAFWRILFPILRPRNKKE